MLKNFFLYCVFFFIISVYVSPIEAAVFIENSSSANTQYNLLSKSMKYKLLNPLIDYEEKTPPEKLYYLSQRYLDDDSLKILEFKLTPNVATPGASVKMTGEYVLYSSKKSLIALNETRILEFYDSKSNKWKELGRVQTQLETQSGKSILEGTFDIPSEMEPGTYKIVLVLSAFNKQDSKSDTIEVIGGNKKIERKDLNVSKNSSITAEPDDNPCKIIYDTFLDECIGAGGNVSRATMSSLNFYSTIINTKMYEDICEKQKNMDFKSFQKLVCTSTTTNLKSRKRMKQAKNDVAVISDKQIMTRHGIVNLLKKENDGVPENYISFNNKTILMDGNYAGFEKMYKLKDVNIFVYSFSVGNAYEGKQLIIDKKDGLYVSEDVGYIEKAVEKKDTIIFKHKIDYNKDVSVEYDGNNLLTNHRDGKWGKWKVKLDKI